MKKNASLDGKKIDWMITLLPLGIIIALCILFFFMPEQSNAVLSQIRFFLWRYLWNLLFDNRTWNISGIYLYCRVQIR